MRKATNDSNIIKGLLKESLFLDLEMFVECEKSKAQGRIVELQNDGSILIFIEDGATTDSFNSSVIKASILFRNFLAITNAEVVSWRSPFLLLKQPDSIELSDNRTERRHYFEMDSTTWSRAVLIANENEIPCNFRPTNISPNGIGGELSYPTEFTLTPDTTIKCSHYYVDQWLNIEGKIKSIRQLSNLHDKNSYCIIGIEYKKPERLKSTIYRPRSSRLACDFDIECSVPTFLNKVFNLKVVNVSVSGFLAKITSSDTKELTLTTRLLVLQNSSMRAELVSVEDDLYRFQWTEGNSSDRLKWLKKISIYVDSSIDPINLRHEDILSLFCQSGALSDAYVREQKNLSQMVLTALMKSGQDEPWAFRWTNRGLTGKAKAYACAMRSGENSWSLIDLVSDRYNEKMSNDFWPNYLTSLKDYSLSLTPCPTQFFAWVKGHKFHSDFEAYLRTAGQDYLLGECEMFYTRLTRSTRKSSPHTIQSYEIVASNYSYISLIQQKISKSGMESFSESMDLCVNTFGSPGLKNLFQTRGLPFKRQYWHLVHTPSSKEFVCIFTLIPEGHNPGRFLDSIFVFDINNATEEIWMEVKDAAISIAAAGSYSTHAIRRLAASGKSQPFGNEVATMTALVLHPRAWDFYSNVGKKKSA